MAGTQAFSRWFGCAVAALAVGIHSPSIAQQAPIQQAPVQQQLPSRAQLEPPPPPPVEPSRVVVNGDGAVPAADCPLSAYDVDITVQQLAFTAPDGSALPAEVVQALAGVAADLPQGPQKIAVVCALRDRATLALRTAGYIASVQIPPQRIETGTLTLQVVTAHIVEVRVRGDAGPFRGTLARRIEQLQALNPLNARDAERILLLADDVPGFDVQLTLRPAGTEPGAVIGELNVNVLRARVLANVQNYGSAQLGRETLYGRVELYGLTGASDMTYVGGQVTADFREQQVVQFGHQTGIGSSGLRFSIGGTYAWSRPSIGTLDLRSQSLLTQAELTMPLIRSIRDTVLVAGGFEFDEQRTRIFGPAGSNPLNRDRTRVLYGRITGTHRSLDLAGLERISLSGSVDIRKGLDIFATTLPQSFVDGYTPSRFEGDSRAWVIRGAGSATARVGRIFSAVVRAQAQWADRPLLNLDEFAIGNLTIGRGYDPGANSGDRAVGASGEVRARVIETPKFGLEYFGFYDSVWLYNLDSGAIENNRRLGSWGLGLRAILPRLAQLEATYAHPTDRALLLPGATVAPPRFLLSLTMQYAPRR